MSTAQASGDQTGSGNKKEVQASGAEASCNGQAGESLEDQVRLLHRQIKSSDWLQKNTSEMWMDANPEAAAELKEIIRLKLASQNPPQSESSEESSGGDVKGNTS